MDKLNGEGDHPEDPYGLGIINSRWNGTTTNVGHYDLTPEELLRTQSESNLSAMDKGNSGSQDGALLWQQQVNGDL